MEAWSWASQWVRTLSLKVSWRRADIYGAAPLVIDEDVLIGEVVRLRKSASAGPDTITNAYIRQVMGQEDVRRTLLPFLRLVMGGAVVMGIPVGTDAFIESQLETMIRRFPKI